MFARFHCFQPPSNLHFVRNLLVILIINMNFLEFSLHQNRVWYYRNCSRTWQMKTVCNIEIKGSNCEYLYDTIGNLSNCSSLRVKIDFAMSIVQNVSRPLSFLSFSFFFLFRSINLWLDCSMEREESDRSVKANKHR